MQGRFDISLIGARGLKDHDFDQAVREGRIDELLKELPVERHFANQRNRIMDNMAGYMLDNLFSLGNCGFPYYYRSTGAPEAALANVCLLTTDGEPTYTEDWGLVNSNSYKTIHTSFESANTSSGGKRFEEDQISAWEIWADSVGREAVHFRNRFLYTPTQGVSSSIRSVGIHYRENGDGTDSYSEARARIGRVRIKDAGGVPVILNKLITQVLLIEYTFTLVAM